jgi:ribonuclease BN (tRNA processing enzyme)
MRVTLLGTAGTRPGRCRACSSYLVEHEGYRLLLDCGNGSLSNLYRVVDPGDLDAVLISHQHLDHWADLVGMYYALRFDAERSIPVYGPPGLGEHINGVLPPGDDGFLDTCRFHVANPGDRLTLGPLDVELFAANHPVPTLASRVTADGSVLAYSADSAPSHELVRAARGADVFLADCTWLEPADRWPPGVHMTGAQAGQHASEAGARRLVATHVWPSTDPEDVAAEVREHYDGEVLTCEDMTVLEL